MTEADDTAHAAETINALVEALEKIEHHGCWRRESTGRSCCESVGVVPGDVVFCATCIAHEALTIFRGQ